MVAFAGLLTACLLFFRVFSSNMQCLGLRFGGHKSNRVTQKGPEGIVTPVGLSVKNPLRFRAVLTPNETKPAKHYREANSNVKPQMCQTRNPQPQVN